MALFCPLAENVGTAVEWVAVLVALAGAIAVFMVSRAANSTAKAAKEIQSREAADRQAVANRQALLMLIYIEPELRYVQPRLGLLVLALGRYSRDAFIEDWNIRKRFASDIESISLPLCVGLFSQWHVLSDENAVDLAGLVSGLETMKTASVNAARLDLASSVPTIPQNDWVAFQRNVIASNYETMSSGASRLNAIALRLLDVATAAKEQLTAADAPATPPSTSSATLPGVATSTSVGPTAP